MKPHRTRFLSLTAVTAVTAMVPCCVQQQWQRKWLHQQWQQVADPDRHVAVADG